MHKYEIARNFALTYHAGQWYGNKPYIAHIDSVVAALRWYGADGAYGHMEAGETVVAAYLHDVVEDTEVTLERIRTVFGPDVAAIVDFCTDVPGNTRRERKKWTLLKQVQLLRKSPLWGGEAVAVKVADRYANIWSSAAENSDRGDKRVDMYRREHAAFRDALAPYTPARYAQLWQLIDTCLEER